MKFFRAKLFRALIFSSLLALIASTVYASTITTTVDSIGDVGWYTSLALNSKGFPVISYYDYTNFALKVVVCGNTTCTAGNTFSTVDNSGNVAGFTSLALNSKGFPVISYADELGNLKVAICGNATCTTSNTLTTVDSPGSILDTSLALNGNGFPVISYYDNVNGDLKVVICGNATCSAGNTLTTVDSIGYVGEFNSLALTNRDFPVISYLDSTNQDLKVAVCGNATCTAGNTLTTVDSTGDVGVSTSLALNSNGFPIISYYDYTKGNLKATICGNATCTGGNTLTTVDSIGNVGAHSSLALNNNGLPVISYFDATNQNLKVAICGNATCSAGNTITTVDSIGWVGAYASLELDSNGFPVISYLDYTHEDLKVALFENSPSSLPKTGFAPKKITTLPAQSAQLAYTNLDSLWLEITSLQIKSNIVGVPKTDQGWDVNWLGQDAGWLNGTAFPSWEGNSVITAHVTDSNGLPGPFANIKNLKYGDKIIVHLNGQQYIFEVQSSSMVSPTNTKSAFEHLEGHSYLTLITCQGYNPFSDSYLFRRVVRAVLVEVK